MATNSRILAARGSAQNYSSLPLGLRDQRDTWTAIKTENQTDELLSMSSQSFAWAAVRQTTQPCLECCNGQGTLGQVEGCETFGTLDYFDSWPDRSEASELCYSEGLLQPADVHQKLKLARIGSEVNDRWMSNMQLMGLPKLYELMIRGYDTCVKIVQDGK